MFYDQLAKPEFINAVLGYLTNYKSLVKNEHDYKNSIDYYRDRRKYGVIALYTDKDGHLISTKSEEEKKICGYLTELGVSHNKSIRTRLRTLLTEVGVPINEPTAKLPSIQIHVHGVVLNIVC